MSKKDFGATSRAYEYGYTLDVLISWLEDILAHEQDRQKISKERQRQINLLEDALDKLNQI